MQEEIEELDCIEQFENEEKDGLLYHLEKNRNMTKTELQKVKKYVAFLFSIVLFGFLIFYLSTSMKEIFPSQITQNNSNFSIGLFSDGSVKNNYEDDIDDIDDAYKSFFVEEANLKNEYKNKKENGEAFSQTGIKQAKHIIDKNEEEVGDIYNKHEEEIADIYDKHEEVADIYNKQVEEKLYAAIDEKDNSQTSKEQAIQKIHNNEEKISDIHNKQVIEEKNKTTFLVTNSEDIYKQHDEVLMKKEDSLNTDSSSSLVTKDMNEMQNPSNENDKESIKDKKVQFISKTQIAFKKCLDTKWYHKKPRDISFTGVRPWALDVFVHHYYPAPSEMQVMYQTIPKSGSTALREVMSETYNFMGDRGHPWHTGMSTKNRRSYSRVRGDKKWKNWYKFTFVTDPIKHLIAGCILLSPLGSDKRMKDWIKGKPAPESYAKQFNQYIRRCANGIKARGKSKSWGPLNVHLTPQTYLLRHSHFHGVNLNFLAHLNKENWNHLLDDLKAHGKKIPKADALDRFKGQRVGYNVITINNKTTTATNYFQFQYGDLIELLDTSSLELLCNLTRFEFECLGFELSPYCSH